MTDDAHMLEVDDALEALFASFVQRSAFPSH